MTKNSIGLDTKKTKELAKDLNDLLANFQIYYQNLRGIHWNIQGKRFFELHPKFEELYNDANLKVDEIAERVLTLGETPLHTFDDYTKAAKVPIGKNISEDEKAVRL
ncbi:MAG TPA: ferritin-like domain-containing protein, partial [Aquaticitalea sp.]|nr:ferritin-like domain-containing protein [Aquaticitalea sp.]